MFRRKGAVLEFMRYQSIDVNEFVNREYCLCKIGECGGLRVGSVVLFVEVVSKPVEDDQQAGEFNKSFEQMRVEFVSSNEPSIVKQPSDGSFDDPTVAVASKAAAVLARLTFSSSTMRTDQFDAAFFHAVSEPVGISGFVVQKAFDLAATGCAPIQRYPQCQVLYTSPTPSDHVQDREYPPPLRVLCGRQERSGEPF